MGILLRGFVAVDFVVGAELHWSLGASSKEDEPSDTFFRVCIVSTSLCTSVSTSSLIIYITNLPSLPTSSLHQPALRRDSEKKEERKKEPMSEEDIMTAFSGWLGLFVSFWRCL